MTDTRKLLERQAAWQRGRVALTWPEKIRMAEAVREWAAQFRRARRPIAGGKQKSGVRSQESEKKRSADSRKGKR